MRGGFRDGFGGSDLYRFAKDAGSIKTVKEAFQDS
jgi:hypothetical protein